MYKIFYIMGKSAVGKDKILGKLLDHPKLDLHRLLLYTTRPQRSDETNGVEYIFTDEAGLAAFREAHKLIEVRTYETVLGSWSYFTADDGQMDLARHSYIGIGTLESYEKMKAYYGEEVMRPIYIEVDDGELLGRALKRERKEKPPNYQEMCRRFLADCEDFSEAKIQHAGITHRFLNEDLEECMSEIIKYIENET